jgi:hypothetical protein
MISDERAEVVMRCTLPMYVLFSSGVAVSSWMMPIALAADSPSQTPTFDLTVVLDVDLHARPFDDAADHLAAGADDVANLVDRILMVMMRGA